MVGCMRCMNGWMDRPTDRIGGMDGERERGFDGTYGRRDGKDRESMDARRG